MQTLGLSESTPRTESRLRALFWPTIRNEGDFDYVTRQGFWICVVVAAVTFVVTLFHSMFLAGAFEALFFALAGVGVRQRSRVAAVAAFVAYLLDHAVMVRYTGNGFGIVAIIFLALLFANIRGNWLSARWAAQQTGDIAPERLNETWGDKFADQMPAVVWPKGRYLFYVLATVEIGLLLVALLIPRASLNTL